METNEYSGEINIDDKLQKNKTIKTSLLIVGLSLFILILLGFYKLNTSILGIYSISTSGFLLSIYLLLKEHHFFSNSSFDICKIGNKFDCDTVISSKESKLLGFSLAEISTGFFLFLMLSCINLGSINTSLNYVAPLIYGSLIGVIYSVYQQIKMKQYCIICIAISIFLIFLILTAYNLYGFQI